MTAPIRFDGGTAVITGAASGIGSGLARHAASLGMRLVLADVDQSRLDAFAATLDADVLAVATDVRKSSDVDALAELAWQRYGRVDLLFNNAGVMGTGFTWEISPEEFERSFAVNVHGVLNGIRSFVPRMLKAGTPAHIVNTASIGGFLPSPLMSPYSATKFAVVALTESLYGELKMIDAPIGVSLLAPGPVQSGIFDAPAADTSARPEVRQFVDKLHTMISAYGLTPDEFAKRVFVGIREGDYWLLPQPEMIDEPLRERVAGILARRNPELPAY
ncbi:short chain dehydrogenase/reductase family oxidoreductase [Pandoraea terrae]|uniref:Short chain dehydrogenase/reductase family oxidoreductase n=1 Tax=Pandoraea terrae TaxID=1537710 RepID=A0A5E4XKI2_9BURK|nr:SDR family NAD(P)-dependent oxidoreductase [Pandoraea terrae]VVE36951.1 short chain dehydrogenase/reductase family oxidoreductase [Pandoraea terrae]